MSSLGTRLKQADAAPEGRRIVRDRVERDRSQVEEDHSAPLDIAIYLARPSPATQNCSCIFATHFSVVPVFVTHF